VRVSWAVSSMRGNLVETLFAEAGSGLLPCQLSRERACACQIEIVTESLPLFQKCLKRKACSVVRSISTPTVYPC
jgi:hypothetical protein